MKRTIPLILAVALFMENMDATVIATSPALQGSRETVTDEIGESLGDSRLMIQLGMALGFVIFAIDLPKPAGNEYTDGIVVLTGGPGRIQRRREGTKRAKAARSASRSRTPGRRRRTCARSTGRRWLWPGPMPAGLRRSPWS